MKASKTLWHGVDTAKVGYLVDWPQEFTQTLRSFEQLRAQAQRSANFGHGTYTQLGEHQFMVRPMGARMMPYAFEGMGMVLFVGNTLVPWGARRSVTPNVRIEFQPFSVARHGLAAVHAYALGLIAQLGGVCQGNRLSEIHLTCDLQTDRSHQAADYHTSLEGLWRRVRTRIRSNTQEQQVPTADCGMVCNGTKLKQTNIGKDKKMLRIYDKILELRVHPDKYFEALNWNEPALAEAIFDRAHPLPPDLAVMRIEFQLRRERLLELQISTVEDFLAKQGGLWQHLTEEFVVLINDDDMNRSRCSTQDWWKVVQQAWSDHPTCELPKRIKPLPDLLKYVDQAMGLFLVIGARLGPASELDLTDILSVFQTRWEATHAESWQAIMQAKREQLEVLWADIAARASRSADGRSEGQAAL